MAASMLVSSTLAPLRASKAYASELEQEHMTIMDESIDEIKNDSPATINEETVIDKREENPEKIAEATEIDEVKEKKQSEKQVEEADHKVARIIEKTEIAKVYEDNNFKDLSLENLHISVKGNMPENAIVKAYIIQNPIIDIKKENILGFGYEIFDGEGNVYEKSNSETYEIELTSNKISEASNLYLYEKNKEDIRFEENLRFKNLLGSIKFQSRKQQFTIQRQIPKDQEKIDKNTEIGEKDEEKSPLLINQIIESETDDKKVEDQGFIKKDDLSTLFPGLNEKEKPQHPLDSADIMDILNKNERSQESTIEEEIKSTNENSLPEDTKEKTQQDESQLTEDEIKEKEDKKGAESKDDDANVEEKLSYQQVLANIYQDSSYQKIANDRTRIKLSGDLPGYTKVKAYPVEIEIEGKEVLAAYDIKIFDKNDKEYKVTAKNNIKVQITNQKIKEAKEIEVYHKEDKYSPEERIEADSKTYDTVTFRAESFSIYAITDVEAQSITFVFLNRNENNDREVWDTQTIRNGEKLVQPELPIFSYKGKFEGWYYYDYQKSIEVGHDVFLEAFDFSKPISVDEYLSRYPDGKVYLKGKYNDVIYVNFIDRKKTENGFVDEVISTKEVPLGGYIDDNDVPLLPSQTGSVFAYWSLNPNANPSAGPGKDDAFDFNTEITESTIKSLRGNKNYYEFDLYAIYKQALKVNFDSQGGTYVNNQVIYRGETVNLNQASTIPSRPGYNFKYWSLSKNGPEFSPSTKINNDTTLYAVWEKSQATYTVNYWLENANDDKYTIEKSETKTGVVESLTPPGSTFRNNFDTNLYHAVFNSTKTDSAKEISGDGSTVLNVYYNRNRYNLSFNKIWPPLYRTYSGIKWGADTSTYWNEVNENLTNKVWRVGSLSGTPINEAPVMPTQNLALYQNTITKDSVWYLVLKDVDSGEILDSDEIQVTGIGSRPSNSRYSRRDDPRDIPGYTYLYVNSPGKNDGTTVYIDNQYQITVYYKKNSYDLNFNPKSTKYTVNQPGKVAFNTPLYTYIPKELEVNKSTNENGYVFKGWTTESSGTGPAYDLSTGRMPANNLTLYAKWEAPTYKVRAYRQRNNPAAGFTEVSAKQNQNLSNVIKNNNITLVADKPPVAANNKDAVIKWYSFINGKFVEYDFSAPIRSDVNLYPVWLAPDPKRPGEFRPLSQIYKVRYKVTDNKNEYLYEDPFDYVDNADAIVIAPYVNNKYQFPDGSELHLPEDEVFQGWKIEKKPGTKFSDSMLNKLYQPGDTIPVLEDITFVPELNKFKIITLRLQEINPNGTTQEPILFEYRQHENVKKPEGVVDNREAEDLRNNDTVILPRPRATDTNGYKFLGWSTTPDGNDTPTLKAKIFQPGQEVLITADDIPNVLYGIWKANRTITIHENQPSGRKITYTKENVLDGEFKIPSPNKLDGYLFEGWSIDSNSQIIHYKAGEVINVSESNPLPSDIFGVWKLKNTTVIANLPKDAILKNNSGQNIDPSLEGNFDQLIFKYDSGDSYFASRSKNYIYEQTIGKSNFPVGYDLLYFSIDPEGKIPFKRGTKSFDTEVPGEEWFLKKNPNGKYPEVIYAQWSKPKDLSVQIINNDSTDTTDFNLDITINLDSNKTNLNEKISLNLESGQTRTFSNYPTYATISNVSLKPQEGYELIRNEKNSIDGKEVWIVEVRKIDVVPTGVIDDFTPMILSFVLSIILLSIYAIKRLKRISVNDG